MKELKEFGKLFQDNPMLIVTTAAGMVFGAMMGVMAYYHGWLG